MKNACVSLRLIYLDDSYMLLTINHVREECISMRSKPWKVFTIHLSSKVTRIYMYMQGKSLYIQGKDNASRNCLPSPHIHIHTYTVSLFRLCALQAALGNRDTRSPGLLTLARLLATGPARECHTFSDSPKSRGANNQNDAVAWHWPTIRTLTPDQVGYGFERRENLTLSSFDFWKAKSESARLRPSLLFLWPTAADVCSRSCNRTCR